MAEIKRCITIDVNSEQEKMEIGKKIHEQLVNNQDYIDSNIILNIDYPLAVHLWIFNECENIPEIHI